jgi:hypothetical protein
MRTAIAIFFLTLLSVTQTPVGQLMKIPLLVQHFNKHQQRADVSLLDFLVEHYMGDHHDSDRAEDEQLPFKTLTIQSISMALVPTILRNDAGVDVTAPVNFPLRDDFIPQQHLERIFHPPRA